MLGANDLTDEVVRAAADGSQPDQARILHVLGPRVRLMAAARLGIAPQDPRLDDIVQRVLGALVASWSRLELRTAPGLKSFVSRIVTHKVADALQGRPDGRIEFHPPVSLDSTVSGSSAAGPLGEFLSASGTSPRTALERAELIAALHEELSRLDDEQRAVIVMSILDELPTREIAESLNKTRHAVAQKILRTLATLRSAMIARSARRTLGAAAR